jgi:hypothetical protein
MAKDKLEIKVKAAAKLLLITDNKDKKYDETELEEAIREKAKSNVCSRVVKKDEQPLLTRLKCRGKMKVEAPVSSETVANTNHNRSHGVISQKRTIPISFIGKTQISI